MRSSRAIWAWRKPAEERSPASASSRSACWPRTLTNTRALRKSGLVSTPVTVTNPMRGSLRSPEICAEITSRTASLTRRIRAPGILEDPPVAEQLFARHESTLNPHSLRKLRLHVSRELRAGVPHRACVPPAQRRGDGRALPQVVVVGLGNGRAEAPLKLSLQRHDLLALPLEAAVVGEVQVDLDQADEAHARRVAAVV